MRYMQNIFNYIMGYIKVKIEGFFVERVINKAKKEKINIWGIKREKTTIAYASIGYKDLSKVKDIADKNKCQIEVIKQQGVPVLIKKYKKRKVLLVVILSLFLFLIIMSRFIWNIQVDRNRKN